MLRGINVGGKSIIKMVELKATFEQAGFANVSTFIQSGNVIFESEKHTPEITQKIEEILFKNFHFKVSAVVLSAPELQKVIEQVPESWKKTNDLRCYIAFVKSPTTSDEVSQAVQPRVGIDSITLGPGVLYLSTQLSGITKSGFSKLSSKKIYQEITIRNYTTVKKLYDAIQS